MPIEPEHKPVLHTKKHIARLQRERQQTRAILIVFVVTLIAVLALLAYGYLEERVFQLGRPVATVGNAEISAGQLEARVRVQQRQLFASYNQYVQLQQFGLDVGGQLQQIQTQLDAPQQIGESVLQQMIDEELIRQEAQERGISLTQSEVDQAIEANFDFYPLGTPTATVTPTLVLSPAVPESAYDIVTRTPTGTATLPATATLQATEASTPTLAATRESAPSATAVPSATATTGPTGTAVPTVTPLTREGFQERLDQTTRSLEPLGFGEADYRQFFETLLLRQRLMDVVTSDISPVPEQIWARHILVEQEVIAAAVKDRLARGEDFAALAQEVSKDPASAAKGGDLGWFARGVMVDAFEEVAFSLEPGEISDPVQSDFGWHIIQVIARQERPYTHEEYQQAKETAFNKWLESARVEYQVQTYDFWRTRDLFTRSSMVTVATDVVAAGQTAQAEANRRLDATGTPTP